MQIYWQPKLNLKYITMTNKIFTFRNFAAHLILITIVCWAICSCSIAKQTTYNNGYIQDGKGTVIGNYANGHIFDTERNIKGYYSNGFIYDINHHIIGQYNNGFVTLNKKK